MRTKSLVNQDAARLARSVLFWMGVAYMTIAVHIMTPFTNNLDDVKVTAIHLLGPILIAAYLILLARGLVEIPRAAVSIPLAIYFVVMLLSTALSKPFLHWLGMEQTLIQWVLMGPFLAFFASGVETRRLCHGIIFFSLLALSSVLFGLGHKFGVPGLVGAYVVPSLARGSGLWYFVKGLSDTFAGTNDMLSIILNRDFYAAFLALTLPLTVGSILLSRSFSWQIVASVTFLLGAVCLNMTNSKDSYAATAIALALIAFLYIYVARLPLRYRRRLLTILIGLVCLMSTLVLLNLRHFLGQIKTFDVSFTSRAIIWGGAIGIWKTAPILGAGPGSFRVLFPYHRRPDYLLFDISHRTLSSHNYFLDLLDETGIVGFVVFMTFLAMIFWHCLARVRRDPDLQRRVIGLSLIAGMTGFLLNAITSPNMRWPIGAVNLWSVLGMMAGFIQRPLTAPLPARPLPAAQPRAEAAPRRLLPVTLTRGQAWIVWFLLFPATLALGARAAYFGIQYFRAAYYNNQGLIYLGDEKSPKIVYIRKEELANLRNELKSPGLSANEKAALERKISATEADFERYRRIAERLMRTAADIQPTFSTSLYKLATLVFMGPYDRGGEEAAKDALEVFRRLERFWPEYSQLSYNFFRVYETLGETDKALEAGWRAVRETIDSNTHRPFCRFLIVNGQTQDALEDCKWLVAQWDEALKKPLSIAPEKKEEFMDTALDTLAQVAHAAKDYGTEIEALKRLRAHDPEGNRIAQRIVGLYLLEKDYAGLENAMTEFLQDTPADPVLNYWAGYAALHQGKPRSAMRQALILKRIDPTDPSTDYLQFAVYRLAGRQDEAVRYANAFLKTGRNRDQIEDIQRFLQGKNAPSGTAKGGGE